MSTSSRNPTKIGIIQGQWLQVEKMYQAYLRRIKKRRQKTLPPRCYISHLPSQQEWTRKLTLYLNQAGVSLLENIELVEINDFIIILDTPSYREAFQNMDLRLEKDGGIIRERLSRNSDGIIALVLEGNNSKHEFSRCIPGNFCDETHFLVGLFDLVLNLYSISLTHKHFIPLRQSLHKQWEQTLSTLNHSEPYLNKKRFDVALSFPGEYRKQVEAIANKLTEKLGKDSVFYDKYHEAELARPNLDTHLQTIYHDQSELIVVFLCSEYEKKEWCGLEWRALRDLIKKKETAIIMPMRFDQTEIPGLFSIDGYIDIAMRSEDEISRLILKRLEMNRND